MPENLFHLGAVAQCTHGGPISFTPTNTRVFVNAMAVATTQDIFKVAGCPFQIPVGAGTKPQPCVIAQLAPAPRVLINGSPAVLNLGPSVCRSVEQIPQATVIVSTNQTRVSTL
jgi:hypothetical protein